MTGNTLPRLQTADIENLLIPVPPYDVQMKICESIRELRNEAAHLRQAANAQLEVAKREIEALILGEIATVPTS